MYSKLLQKKNSVGNCKGLIDCLKIQVCRLSRQGSLRRSSFSRYKKFRWLINQKAALMMIRCSACVLRMPEGATKRLCTGKEDWVLFGRSKRCLTGSSTVYMETLRTCFVLGFRLHNPKRQSCLRSLLITETSALYGRLWSEHTRM